MQLNILCPILLLGLSQVAFASAEDRNVVRYLMSFGMTKRADTFLIQPMNMKADEAVPAGGDLTKRQTQCDTGYFACQDFPGACCNEGTFCVQIGNQVGCCPNGKTSCGYYCCAPDQTCTTDTSGNQSCSSGSTTTNTTDQVCGGLTGYVQCTNMAGCCPKGVTCIPPNQCNITCGPTDPPCGTSSCCINGQVCLPDLTCGAAPSGSSFSPLVSPTASSGSNSTSPATTTPKHITKQTSTPQDSTSASPSGETSVSTPSGSSPTTTPKKPLVPTQSVPTTNGASLQTMAALLGGGLGVAVGYLVL